ncbi:MAG: GGDEF domain-containing protein [Chloroflexota bacterium]
MSTQHEIEGRMQEVDHPTQPDNRVLGMHILISRTIGIGLLIAALVIVGATTGGGGKFMLAAGAVIALVLYIFIVESRARKISVNREKRLRLGLLVHNMELENMAMQDELTGLFNRRYLFDRLERELDTAKAFKRSLSVMVIDLDSMKLVNDNFGHRQGDDLLRAFGRFLLDATRASDVPARTGGDEFAIVLPDTNEKAALALRTRLTAKLKTLELVEPDNASLRVSASFGVASYPRDGDTVDVLVQRADIDMYTEKGMHKANVKQGEPQPVATQQRWVSGA